MLLGLIFLGGCSPFTKHSSALSAFWNSEQILSGEARNNANHSSFFGGRIGNVDREK